MKISLQWINEFVDITEFLTQPEGLSEKLTRAGFEVEAVTDYQKKYQHLTVGLILEKDKHPQADRLTVCKVAIGKGVVLQIVCGATNHKSNDLVVVALPGCRLPGGLEIKKSAVRGVDSEGMLCSLKELGLPGDSEGIVILKKSVEPGVAFAEAWGLTDVLFELKVTPNRADGLSHFGLAREISALLQRPMKEPSWKSAAINSATEAQAKIKNVKLVPGVSCSRYSGRSFTDIKVGDSPEWLVARLEKGGFKSINNVVDVTNYVMLEYGQPMHAFDAQSLEGDQVVVQAAQAGQDFETLDGTVLKLSGSEMMISDGQKNLCIAGIIGGKNSGVNQSTTEVFLESAHFEADSIRKSLRFHGLQTESAYRFSRGVDPHQTLTALARASQLLMEVAGARPVGPVIDVTDLIDRKREPIAFHRLFLNERLGYVVPFNQALEYLTSLHCQIEKVSDDEVRVTAPSFRMDIEQEMDLIEEVARMHGYEHIPETLPAFVKVPSAVDPLYILTTKVSQILVAQGLRQALNLVFTDQDSEKSFYKGHPLMAADEESVKVLNPLAQTSAHLKRTLLADLFKNAIHNFHQGNEVGRFFEINKVFRTIGGERKESYRLSFVFWGLENRLGSKEQPALVTELTQTIKGFFQSLVGSAAGLKFEPSRTQTYLHTHRQLQITDTLSKSAVGLIGELHPELLQNEKLRVPVAVAEFDLEAHAFQAPQKLRVNAFSRQQKADRDLSVVLPAGVSVGLVLDFFAAQPVKNLIAVQVYDVFSLDQAGLKSVTFRFSLRNDSQLISDAEIASSMQEITGCVTNNLKLSVR